MEHFDLTNEELTMLYGILKDHKNIALTIIKQAAPELYPEQAADHITDLMYDIEVTWEYRKQDKA